MDFTKKGILDLEIEKNAHMIEFEGEKAISKKLNKRNGQGFGRNVEEHTKYKYKIHSKI